MIPQQSGDLQKEPGRQLIASRMTDAAQTLTGLYAAAWDASEPTRQKIKTFVKFDSFGEEMSRAIPQPAGTYFT